MLFHLKPQPCFPLLKLRSERFFSPFFQRLGIFPPILEEGNSYKGDGGFPGPWFRWDFFGPRMRGFNFMATVAKRLPISLVGELPWVGRWAVEGLRKSSRETTHIFPPLQRGREVRKLNRQTNMCWFGKRGM